MSANKAEREGYQQEPFFKFIQNGHADLVAWAGGAKDQESLFWVLTNLMGDKVEYLFKEYVSEDQDQIHWRRVSGEVLVKDLVGVVQNDRELFFHDSGFQLCLRSYGKSDYFAYDEHGIFWIYSKDNIYSQTLLKAGFKEKDAPLICDSGHWHVRPPDAEKRLEKLIKLLMEHSQSSKREK